MKGTFFKHLAEPRSAEKARKKREAQEELDAAYAIVDRRDGGVCWATGRLTHAGAIDAKVRREHHHIQPRSTHPELVNEPDNVVTLCAEAHRLIKLGFLVQEGTTAKRGALRFHWADHAPASVRTFRIASRRRSQQVA